MLYFYVFILYFAKLYAADPFILDDLSICNYNSSNDDTSFTSKLWMVEDDNVIIYYTLCGYVQGNICGMDDVAACIKYKQHNLIKVLGKKFVLGNDVKLSLETEYGGSCKNDSNGHLRYKLTIKLGCFQEIEETHLEMSNDCEYVIRMMSPKSCEPKCTTRVNGQLIDLRPLKGDFFIQSAGRNFSITLCGANRLCADKDISICEITDGISVPLSEFKNEVMVFNKEKNDIAIRGSYRGSRSKGKKKVELIIKCNWDRTSSNIVDKTPPQLRKNYKFEMESSFGCIKLPPSCVIAKDFLTYNLTNLHNSNGYLQVSNVPKGNIYLNICGPLRLPQNDTTNNCSISQVCEVNNGKFLNKGSTLSNFEIADDIIKATFINGATCEVLNEPFRQYETHVELFCSKTEEGPKFVRSEICDTFIHWNTPLACPSYNKSKCTYIHQEFKKCSIHLHDRYYDLGPLTLKGSNYDVQDTSNSSILYRLNVCGPVTDSDAPCMKHSMVVMKDLNQNNIKHRLKSLGKMDSMIIVNGNVVIITSSGTYCGGEGDYSSIITFICSDVELPPKLINSTECTFHFEWKSRYACPVIQGPPEKKCIIENAANNISLNFSKIKQTSLRVNLSKMYDFDLCKENYSECLKENCTSFPIKKELMTRSDKTYLQLTLPKQCDLKADFNILSFELICDNIINNEHFKVIGVDDCTFKMELSTNLICSQQRGVIDLSEKYESDRYDIPREQVLEKDQENCSVSNHLTGYKFYISNLQLDIPILHCPVISFDNEKSSVMLTYSDSKICQESKESGTYEYMVILKCSKDELKDMKKLKCSEVYTFEKPEFCKLFETSFLDGATHSKSSASNAGKIIGSIIGVLGFFGICTVCFLLHRKYKRKAYNTIYEKDADL